MTNSLSFSRWIAALVSIACLSLLFHLQITFAKTEQSLSKAQKIQNGVQLETDSLNVKVQFYAENIARVVKWSAGGTAEKKTLAVIQNKLPDLKLDLQENAEAVTLSSSKITVQISKSDGTIQY